MAELDIHAVQIASKPLEEEPTSRNEELSSESDDDSDILEGLHRDSVRKESTHETAKEPSHLSPYDYMVTGKPSHLSEESSEITPNTIQLPESVTLLKMGTVRSIIDNVVVVEADRDSAPLDLDSLLFLSRDRILGRIFDVFGPVIRPLYSVRFRTAENIPTDVQIGMDTFVSPADPQLTSYVFVHDLRQHKGTDASWEDNSELPEELVEFSDDEAERQYKQQLQRKKRLAEPAATAPVNRMPRKPQAPVMPRHPVAAPRPFAPWMLPPRPEAPLMYPGAFAHRPCGPIGPPAFFPRMPANTAPLQQSSHAPVLPPPGDLTTKIVLPQKIPVAPSLPSMETLSFTEAKPLITSPKLLPGADMLFYNPKDDPTVNQSKSPFPSRPFLR